MQDDHAPPRMAQCRRSLAQLRYDAAGSDEGRQLREKSEQLVRETEGAKARKEEGRRGNNLVGATGTYEPVVNQSFPDV